MRQTPAVQYGQRVAEPGQARAEAGEPPRVQRHAVAVEDRVFRGVKSGLRIRWQLGEESGPGHLTHRTHP
jgi:hypothetical protein